MALLLLCAAQFIVILDITVVNVALPSIQGDVGVATKDLQWIVTAYTLALGGLLLLGGRLADLAGRRRIFVIGLLVFTLASLGSALAGSPAVLILARALQGVGAAMLSPAALSLLSITFPEGPERHRALAAWAAVAAAGSAVGVLLGGVLTELLGWRSIFLINLPIGVVIALAAPRLLPAGEPSGKARLDVAGAALATGSLTTVIYALVEADAAGWGSTQTLGLLGLGLVGVAAFVAVESRVREPLVSLTLFRRRLTVAALLLMMLGMGSFVAAFFFCSLYLQQVLGHSALVAGLEFLPGAVAIVIAAHAGGHLIGRVGAKPVIGAGLGVGAIGALLLSGLSADGSYLTDVLPGLLALDLGVGLAASGIMITAMSGAGHDDAGLVSGLTTTAHELGIALILPVLSTVAVRRLGDVHAAEAGGAAALASSFGDALLTGALLLAAAALLAMLLLRRGDVARGAVPAMVHH